jgi:hypothetical protein
MMQISVTQNSKTGDNVLIINGNPPKITRYQSKVMFLGLFEIMVQKYVYTDLILAKAYSKLLLKHVKGWARPFCYVVWEKQ